MPVIKINHGGYVFKITFQTVIGDNWHDKFEYQLIQFKTSLKIWQG